MDVSRSSTRSTHRHQRISSIGIPSFLADDGIFMFKITGEAERSEVKPGKAERSEAETVE